MVHIDFFTEGESERIVLETILPRLTEDYTIFTFNGKMDLFTKLPDRLRAYRHPPLSSHKLIILVDRDNDDCHITKSRLEDIITRSGLISKKSDPDCYQVITRVAIEELESWYFGDITALNAAYPTIPLSLQNKEKYRNPDSISKPSNALLSLLRDSYPASKRLPKLEVASLVSENMRWDENTSDSFNAFYSGIRDILSRY